VQQSEPVLLQLLLLKKSPFQPTSLLLLLKLTSVQHQQHSGLLPKLACCHSIL
jgi:hypothetical protein